LYISDGLDWQASEALTSTEGQSRHGSLRSLSGNQLFATAWFEELCTALSLRGLRDGTKPLVEHALFHVFLGVLILANGIMVGVQVDQDLGIAGLRAEIFLAAVWFWEAALKIWTWGPKKYFGQKSNVFDFVICVLSIVDVALHPVGMHGISAMKLFSYVVQVLRILRIFMFFKKLRLLLAGLMSSAAALVWVMLLICSVIYTFAICFTYVMRESCDDDTSQTPWDDCEEHFGSLGMSMLSLWEIMFSPADVRHLVTHNPVMTFPVVLFVMVTSLGLMNIIIGVIVEETLQTARRHQELLAEKKLMEQRKELDQLTGFSITADSDFDNKISKEEFLEICREKPIQALFAELNLPVSRPRLAIRLFEVLDADGDGKLDRNYVVDRIASLKREGRLVVNDQSMLLMDVRHLDRRLTKLEKSQNDVVERLDKLPQKVAALLEDKSLPTVL